MSVIEEWGNSSILSEVRAYYSQKIQKHGACAQGVDWKNEDSQYLRFQQLAKIVDIPSGFSINDFGCGYGAFVDFLAKQRGTYEYHGVDVSVPMIEQAKQTHSAASNCSFRVGDTFQRAADFTIASGIFNVRLSTPTDVWRGYVIGILDKMSASSTAGFSFNCLTSYSDSDRMRDDLYYADPCYYFDYCKRHYSRNVSLLHDYGLYEFTVLVRKA